MKYLKTFESISDEDIYYNKKQNLLNSKVEEIEDLFQALIDKWSMVKTDLYFNFSEYKINSSTVFYSTTISTWGESAQIEIEIEYWDEHPNYDGILKDFESYKARLQKHNFNVTNFNADWNQTDYTDNFSDESVDIEEDDDIIFTSSRIVILLTDDELFKDV